MGLSSTWARRAGWSNKRSAESPSTTFPPPAPREGPGEGLLDDEWFRENDQGDRRLTTRARHLRQNRTEAERKLWTHISGRKLAGVRFNQQFPVGGCICDFVSRQRRLVIELDGGQHALAAEYDTRRTRFLESRGYQVIRFWNNDVLDNIEGVLKVIEDRLANMPSPNPSRGREGSLPSPARSGGQDS